MSSTMNHTEKSIKPVQKSDAARLRRSADVEADVPATPIDRARRDCSRKEHEDFSVLGRLLAVR